MEKERAENLGLPSKRELGKIIALADQVAEGDMKVIPGKRWGFHYSQDPSTRSEKLQGLVSERYSPTDVEDDLKPDALIYDVSGLAGQSYDHVLAYIRDITGRAEHVDYGQLSEFVKVMSENIKDVSLIRQFFDSITQSSIRKKLLDIYGSIGSKQIQDVIQREVQYANATFQQNSFWDNLFSALKAEWAFSDLKIINKHARDAIVNQLNDYQKGLFNAMRKSYRKYSQSGDVSAFRDFIKQFKDAIGSPAEDNKDDDQNNDSEADKSSEGMSPEMEDLMEDLEPLMEQEGMPGTPEDSATPPDEQDEYITSDPGTGGGVENQKALPFFTIEPAGTSKSPLVGNYCSGHKSYFDSQQKIWSKKKQLSVYQGSLNVQERQRISAVTDGRLKSIPIPNSYALDTSTLQYSGSEPTFFRDQNGSFYIETNGHCEFSIEFGKEQSEFAGKVVSEDTDPLFTGSLSTKTEDFLSNLQGSSMQKAAAVQKYIISNHYYPAGGDLKAAQALQHKLRMESTEATYLPSLDSSTYLECYSSNTLCVHMMRKLGIPARLVTGHKLDGSNAKEGKSFIDQSTGHAWAEMWDGSKWQRTDATPQPNPQDKKKDEGGEKESSDGTKIEEADDSGIEPPDQGEPGEEQPGEGQPGEGQPGEGQPGEGQPGEGQPGEGIEQEVQDRVDQKVSEVMEEGMDGMPEVSDSEISEGESVIEESREAVEEMEQERQDLSERIEEAESFEDLKQLQEEMESKELIEQMEKDLEDRLDAKKEQMKQELKDHLEEMSEDGFLDEDRLHELEEKMDELSLDELEKLQNEIDEESNLYDKYDAIREEVMPLVEHWYEYFAERLPRENEVDFDEDALTRSGAFNRKSVMRYRNILFGTVKNPRIINPSIQPKFIASILVDVSGSMQGEKLENARKLLVFYCELFNLISKEFGYIRFSINIFSDSVNEIKTYEQDYDSPDQYDFSDGTAGTTKMRLMKAVETQGGTNMLDAIKKASSELSEEKWEYPDFASALYFIGDGGDTCGNSDNVRKFMKTNDEEVGFGEHMHSACFIGDESERRVLVDIFGDENTTVASTLEDSIERNMERFGEDIDAYMMDKVK